jgi:hypothetical protein
MKCPKCGGLELGNRRRRNAFYPLTYATVLGLPLAQVHQASAPREYHCAACGLAFSRRTMVGRIAFVVLIVWGAWYALAIVVGLLWLMLR